MLKKIPDFNYYLMEDEFPYNIYKRKRNTLRLVPHYFTNVYLNKYELINHPITGLLYKKTNRTRVAIWDLITTVKTFENFK